MKTLEQLTNIDKAKIMFDLFRDEIPAFMEYTQTIADRVINEREKLWRNWANPLLNFSQWLTIAEQVNNIIKRESKGLAKSGNTFSEKLFSGYLALFTNHCLEQYGTHQTQSPRFEKAINLFYLPV